MNDERDQIIEERKLELEAAKIALEDKWRRNTYRWSILSALLSAAVTIGVAVMAAGGSSAPATPEIAEGPVQACRDSLRRLNTLSDAVSTQTVADLSAAIRLHDDRVLVGILAELRK